MLLFLDSAPLVESDGSGRPLAGASLRFYHAETLEPATVYSDEGLSSVLAQPIVSDSAGEFAAAYLNPAVSYRSRLVTSDGRLVWDVDPYELVEDILDLRRPRVHALIGSVPQPGATLTFYSTGTSVKRDTFADALLETPHPNPIRADAGGFFPPIYMDGVYRVVPSWTDEIDPYPVPAPEPSPTFAVTIASVGGDLYGYDSGDDPVYGSIDPDPPTLSGGTIVLAAGEPSGDRFLFSIPEWIGDIPSPYTGIEVEVTDGVFVELLFSAATIVGGSIWRWDQANDWNASTGQTRDVRIV